MTLAIPDVPDNVYQLLVNASNAVDTANDLMKRYTSHLNGMQNDTNKAVSNVLTTSHGLTTDTLGDIWTSSQVDFGVASDALSTYTSKSCMGGSPTPLRAAVEAGKTAIQNGVLAIGRRSAFRRTATSQQLSFEDTVEGMMQDQYMEKSLGGPGLLDILPTMVPAIEQFILLFPGLGHTLLREIVEWTMDIQDMESALSNVALALEIMLIGLNNLNNNGFSSGTCATGFVPGSPLPFFPTNAFLMKGSDSGGSDPYQDLANKLKSAYADTNINIDEIVLWGEEQHLSPTQIEDLLKSFDANNPLNGPLLEQLLQDGKINGSNVDDVIAMLNSGVDPQTIGQWLNSGLVNSSNIGDVTTLAKSGVDPQTVTGWLDAGRNIHQLAVTAETLTSEGVSTQAINALFKQNINFDNAPASVQTLLRKGVSIDDINNRILNSTDVNSWNRSLRQAGVSQGQITDCLQRWKNGTSTGVGNDGQVFANRPQRGSRGSFQPPFPNPVGTVREYYVNYPGGARILVDDSGRAYFYSNAAGHYDPDTRVPIPFDVLLSLLG